MATRDRYHELVKNALQDDGWTITHDPFHLEIGTKRLSADLGAERLISAEKGIQKIVVEIKSFLGRSDVDDLEDVLGQYILYREVMQELKINRDLFLAVPHRTFTSLFQIPVGQILLQHHILNLVVYDERREVITEWMHT